MASDETNTLFDVNSGADNLPRHAWVCEERGKGDKDRGDIAIDGSFCHLRRACERRHVGAVILIIFPELLRFLGMPSAIAAPMRQMIYGLLLIVLMLKRPQGIMGAYRFK